MDTADISLLAPPIERGHAAPPLVEAGTIRRLFHQTIIADRAKSPQQKSLHTRLAWRLVREIAILRGDIALDEPLVSAMPDILQWLAIKPLREIPSTNLNFKKMLRTVAEKGGVPLILVSDPKYPQDPRVARLWCFAARQIAVATRLIVDDEGIPDKERDALEDLLRMDTSPLVFPSPEALLEWEQIVMDDILTQLIGTTTPKVVSSVRDTYRVSYETAVQLVRMTRNAARHITESDKDQNRTLMILRMEEIIKRAKDNIDLRSELMALKAMAALMSLHHEEEESDARDFVATVRRVASKPLPPPGVKASLPPPPSRLRLEK